MHLNFSNLRPRTRMYSIRYKSRIICNLHEATNSRSLLLLHLAMAGTCTSVNQSINHFIVIRHDRTHTYTREIQWSVSELKTIAMPSISTQEKYSIETMARPSRNSCTAYIRVKKLQSERCVERSGNWSECALHVCDGKQHASLTLLSVAWTEVCTFDRLLIRLEWWSTLECRTRQRFWPLLYFASSLHRLSVVLWSCRLTERHLYTAQTTTPPPPSATR